MLLSLIGISSSRSRISISSSVEHKKKSEYSSDDDDNVNNPTNNDDHSRATRRLPLQGCEISNKRGPRLKYWWMILLMTLLLVTLWRDNFSFYHPQSQTAKHKIGRPRPLNATTIASMNIGLEIPNEIKVFYTNTRMDRSGGAIQDMLMAHAFAWTLGREYGGVCGPESPHAADHRRMIQVLGLQDELPYPLKPRPCDSLVSMTNSRTSMVLPRESYMKWKDTAIFTPNWIKYIRQQQQRPSIIPLQNSSSMGSTETLQVPRTNVSFETQRNGQRHHQYQQLQQQQQTQDVVRVIVYIRRGDVTPCMEEHFRYIPNSHFVDLIHRYTTTNNSTSYHVTIYSESTSFEGWQDFQNISITSHNNHSQSSGNVTLDLVLDADSALVWTDMLGNAINDEQAQQRRIFILSPSSFSLVPAILANPDTTTIVYTKFWHAPLPKWEVVDHPSTKRAESKTIELRKQYCSATQ